MFLINNSFSDRMEIAVKTAEQNYRHKEKQNPASEWLQTVSILSEALSQIKEFSGETFVIKCSENVINDPVLARQFAEDVVLLKQLGINPIVVHGGESQISKKLEQLKIQSSFINGVRVVDSSTIEILEMVLSGLINKQIVAEINAADGMAIGISGKDSGLIEARKLRNSSYNSDSNIEQIVDFGFVGEPVRINTTLLQELSESSIIPVIAPIAFGKNGEIFSLDANTVAGCLAAAIAAKKLIIISDALDGMNQGNKKLSISEARKLSSSKKVSTKIITKLETCLHALENDCESAHILDGSLPHALLMAIFTKLEAGTMIYQD